MTPIGLRLRQQALRARVAAAKLVETGRDRIAERRPPSDWHADIALQDFSGEQVGEFRFFQFNQGSADFFFSDYPSLEVSMRDTPHFGVASAVVSADRAAQEEAKERYLEYLRASWTAYRLDTAPSELDARHERLVQQVNVIKAADDIEPIFLTTLPGHDGYFVVDGNHRCSVAAALGIGLSAKVIPFADAFDEFMRVDAFYGTGHRDMPYQTIYVGDVVVREGRRDDIFDRLALLPDHVLADKAVLDVGSNIGMNAIAAFRAGVRTVHGLELSTRLTNYAARLAVFNQAYPFVSFEAFDLDKQMLPADASYDMAFMFSVHDHLESAAPLVRIACENVREAVIFEGHPGADLASYAGFIDQVGFSEIDEVGMLGTSVFDRRPTRPLWIMRK